MIINREISEILLKSAAKMPVITVTGPRQSGKTTLVKNIFPNYSYVNMELPLSREIFNSDPIAFIKNIKSGIIIDEFQNVPEILSYIQVDSDDNPIPGKYILTGSQNFLIMEKISQSLAGRTALFYLLPLSLSELKGTNYEMHNSDDYILKGFYPRIYKDNLNSHEWLTDYINLYIERDIRNIVNVQNLSSFSTLLKLCAGRIGQVINYAALSDIIGKDSKTIKAWISALEASYVIYLLKPYYNNFNKRITKSPKLFFYDTGVACTLLGIKNPNDIENHYLKGQLFENFVISDILKYNFNYKKNYEFYYWNEQGKSEVDLLIDYGSKISAIEIKASHSFSSAYMKNLINFKEIVGKRFYNASIISNMDEEKRVKDIKLINWKNMYSVFD